MKEMLGDEYEAFLSSYEQIPLRGLRVNRLKDFSVDLAPVPWCGSGFYFPADERPSKTLAYAAGLFYIQEPSAMCPVEVLEPRPGERVLDMCAAPGGKSVQIAGFMQGEGLLVSNDASPTRSRALVKNLERAGIRNAVVLTELPKKLAARFPEFFDRILVDAPCSGEGMFRRDADVVKAYTANKPEACVAMQMEILHHAAELLKPGGRMVYSTCTFNTMENEGVISAFLDKHEEFSLVEIDHTALGISPGRMGEQQAQTATDPGRMMNSTDLSRTARLWPHKLNGEGHFVACLQKSGGINEDDEQHCQDVIPTVLRNSSDYIEPRTKTYLKPDKPPKEFEAFCDDFLINFNMHRSFRIHNASIYIQPEPLDLRGLRVARSGWHVGDILRDRFEPSQAFAMGLTARDAVYSVELSEEDAWRYLRGESLESTIKTAHKKPWVLICHENHPLGWAKLVQGRLKNQLPTGWVMS